MEIHSFASVKRKNEYIEFLRTRALSVGVYSLAVGAVDSQQPHNEEEIYFVVSGQARFSAGDRDEEVTPGDVLFVEAGEPHHFHSITEPLELLVFFAPPEGSAQALPKRP